MVRTGAGPGIEITAGTPASCAVAEGSRAVCAIVASTSCDTAPASRNKMPRLKRSAYSDRESRLSASSRNRRDRSIGPEVNVAKNVRKYR